MTLEKGERGSPLRDGGFRPPQPPGNPEALEGARVCGRPVLPCANPEGRGDVVKLAAVAEITCNSFAVAINRPGNFDFWNVFVIHWICNCKGKLRALYVALTSSFNYLRITICTSGRLSAT